MPLTNGDRFAEAVQAMAAATQSLAVSMQGIQESTRVMAQTQQSLAQTTQRLDATHRLALRVQTFALTLIGLTLLGGGFLVWQHIEQSRITATLVQALQTETRVLEDLLRQRQP